MADNPHSPDESLPPGGAQETPIDAGSQALSEALRSSFGIVKFVMGLLALLFAGSGVFTVGPQQQAMILRLGRPVGEGKAALLGPGLHWSWPYPIDEYVKVPISSIQTVRSTVGWFAITPADEAAGIDMQLAPGTPLNPLVDGSVLTADTNIIHVRASLTYHIADPVGYVFNFVNASNTVQTALNNTLLEVAARFKVDEILYRDVAGFKEAVKRRIGELVDSQSLGIVVEDCSIESRPPRQLSVAFAGVLDAEVKRGNVLNAARSYENQVLSRASADAQSSINTAEVERALLVNDVRSQADRFNDLLPKYRANPSLFVQRRLTETLGRVLTNVQDKIFLTESVGGKEKELRLLLNREPTKKNDGPRP
ncbi:MAG TPA: protease modulator HflK [Candidatus Acidoferrum sp.]|jgi:membrane protease subunit HflK|nr:protease modulator HflK [Candidatus Acidoferrum sp.]